MAAVPTITDIARAAGVSKATVSAVLNQKPSVSEETRTLVQGFIRDLRYQPRAAARLRRDGGTPVIGVIVKEVDNPFYAEVAAGVIERAREAGYAAVVLDSHGEGAEEVRLVKLLCDQGAAGIVLAPTLDPQQDLAHLYDLKQKGYPFVLLESAGSFHLKTNIVDIDNVAAAQLAARHLIEIGHTRLLHFAGPAYSAHSRERVEGVRRAFSESRLIFSESVVVPTGFRSEDGYRTALDAFAERPAGPVGVTCFNDLVALGVWKAVLERGLRVPDDVSLVGYDDVGLLSYLPFGLTTVHTPNREMGGRAADLLVRHIDGTGGPVPERHTLPATLVDRGSTRPVAPLPLP